METKNNPSESEMTAPDSPGEFFRKVSIEFLIHELKGPVAIIETGVRTLLDKQDKFGRLTTRQQKTLMRVLKNSQKARNMLYDLLETGRSEAGCILCCGFQPAETVYDTLLEVLEFMAVELYDELKAFAKLSAAVDCLTRNGIFLNVAPEVYHTEMIQDETKFRQVIANLIKNALHHRRNRLEINVALAKESLQVQIADDGPGVTSVEHETIFRRYAQAKSNSTAKRSGHGLGLAGARITARCLGGDITLESDEGQGAVFHLNLPLTFKSSNALGE